MIKILVDSTCDISKHRAEKLDIEVIPLKVNFDGVIYEDGVDLTSEEFFNKLEKAGDKLPTTSQVNPSEFTSVFKKHIDNGDEILCLCVSSKLSGTLQSAFIAKGDFIDDFEKIQLVDSLCGSYALNLLIGEVCKKRDEGYSLMELKEYADNLAKRVRLYVTLDTLKYLVYGGRISKFTGKVGSALRINPILMLEDGMLVQAGKARGKKLAYKVMVDKCKEDIDFNYPICFGHSHAHKGVQTFKDFCNEFIDVGSSDIYEIGAVIGTHSGPGAVGIAYITKEK